MNQRHGFLKKGMILLLTIALAVSLAVAPVHAAKDEHRVVKVAYPIQPGISMVDENGNYSGYNYEFLEEIAQYTGWEYEFVQVPGDINESITTLMDMLARGEIDLMGSMLFDEQLAERYDYNSVNYGIVETVLQVPYNNANSIIINSQEQQKLRIAVLRTTGQRIRELEDYCKINLIEPEYVLCNSVEEQLAAVQDGRADTMLNTTSSYVEGVRSIASFAPKPYYFITTKGKESAFLDELNAAILSIQQSSPDFMTSLQAKYFTSSPDTVSLSEAVPFWRTIPRSPWVS